MNRLLLGLFAASITTILPAVGGQAADLSLPPPPIFKAHTAGYSWTGCYIGGSAGYGWTSKGWDLIQLNNGAPAAMPDASQSMGSGFTGGGQVGCDVQLGSNWVLGVEASWYGNSLSASAAQMAAAAGYRVDWDAALVGKLGWIPAQGWMVYALGGLAGGDITGSATVNCVVSPAFCGSTGFSNVHSGWTAGVGIEHLFTQYISAKLEYRYTDLGNQALFLPGGVAGTGFNASTTAAFNKVLGGINVRF